MDRASRVGGEVVEPDSGPVHARAKRPREARAERLDGLAPGATPRDRVLRREARGEVGEGRPCLARDQHAVRERRAAGERLQALPREVHGSSERPFEPPRDLVEPVQEVGARGHDSSAA